MFSYVILMSVAQYGILIKFYSDTPQFLGETFYFFIFFFHVFVIGSNFLRVT
jgi:hypothetical protein